MKSPVFVAIALILGAIAAFLAASWMSDVQPSGTKVVIVTQQIEAGKSITADQVKSIDWPGSDVPQNSFSNTVDVVDRVARMPLIPGEPVLPGKLAPEGSTGGLSSIIPDGKRAITVRVNEVVAVAGFALPGSYVDVLVNGKDTRKQKFSRTVLSRVKVLAVDQVTTGDPDKPKVVNAVTLELTPQESEKLDLARNIGKLSLVLRNELDTSTVNSSGARLPDIVYPHSDRSAIPAPAAEANLCLRNTGPEEIRGTSRKHVANP
ncbi:Flp pilus assembly protein CpaB [Prosthecochloris sp. N3]|uniref:Flp pilus assembly protein CpaB n=1 Tax=Prosthecochloris ethylica TaxID=2743976 RepID=A0ABR9XQ23_9CHLB|nr:Flp pilus assembly protein CpaB [Prosthecochloris ethylica]MBF0586281.1 Flp pilus assembly protein CpaB [Prosthecochloris ethylica]MBF0635987.1 Flp pilus assembly protein CpaB [Prosthecochloris ethylica]NUK47338.1 Flp pilus assembly protein CpaB [Prosthecochloris ethylica]